MLKWGLSQNLTWFKAHNCMQFVRLSQYGESESWVRLQVHPETTKHSYLAISFPASPLGTAKGCQLQQRKKHTWETFPDDSSNVCAENLQALPSQWDSQSWSIPWRKQHKNMWIVCIQSSNVMCTPQNARTCKLQLGCMLSQMWKLSQTVFIPEASIEQSTSQLLWIEMQCFQNPQVAHLFSPVPSFHWFEQKLNLASS